MAGFKYKLTSEGQKLLEKIHSRTFIIGDSADGRADAQAKKRDLEQLEAGDFSHIIGAAFLQELGVMEVVE